MSTRRSKVGDDRVRVHCNECCQMTNHRCVHQHTQHQTADHDDSIWSHDTYELLECCGCESVTLRRTWVFSENDPEDPDVYFYPPRAARKRPSWIHDVEDADVRGMLDEIYSALHANSRRLALMGCRAVLDRRLQAQVGDLGSFAAMLKAARKQGLISKPHNEVLKSTFDAGSAAAHRGYNPSEAVLELVVDIVENVLRAGILSTEIKQVSASTPPRAKKNPGGGAPGTTSP